MSDVAIGALIGGGFALMGLIVGKAWDALTDKSQRSADADAELNRWVHARQEEHDRWWRDRRADTYARFLAAIAAVGLDQDIDRSLTVGGRTPPETFHDEGLARIRELNSCTMLLEVYGTQSVLKAARELTSRWLRYQYGGSEDPPSREEMARLTLELTAIYAADLRDPSR